MRRRAVPLLVGGAMLLLALGLPAERVQFLGASGQISALAVLCLRGALGSLGIALLALTALGPLWQPAVGMPASATGLLLGPTGWAGGPRPIAWRGLAAITALGLALRLPGLNSDLWLDEIGTVVTYMRLPPWQVLSTYESANQHLLYSLLGSVSLRLFGESAWAARLPALLYGVAGIPLVYYLARSFADERESLWAAGLLAVSYHHIWFSQSARGYSGMIFWALLGSGLFLRGLARSRDRDWGAYAVCFALGTLTLQNSAFVFISHFAIYGLALARWPSWRAAHWPLTARVVTSMGLGLLLSLLGHSLVLPQVLGFFDGVDRTGLGWTDIGSLAAVVLSGLRSGFGLIGLAVLVLLFAVGLLSYARKSLPLLALFGLPPLLNGAAIVLLNYGAYPRSFLYLLPFGLLLAVRGARRIGELLARPATQSVARWLTPSALLAAIGLASLVSLVPLYRYPKQDYRAALQYVIAKRAPADPVSAVGLAGVSYRAYYAPAIETPETLAEFQALSQPGQHTWVIYSFSRDMRLRFPALYDHIEQQFDLVARFPGTLGDGTVYVARSR